MTPWAGNRTAQALYRIRRMPHNRSELVTALERGLAVLQSFSRESRPMTLSEVARANGLTVATARRSVLTLEKMGYLGRNERRFVLRPRVISMSAGYLMAVRRPFQPFVEEIVRQLHGSASVAVLDSGFVICVAYGSKRPPVDVHRGVGARFPVHATAAGRVLLSLQPNHAIDSYLRFPGSTPRTQRVPNEWRTMLRRIREDRCAFVRDELGEESVSLAVPVFAPNSNAVAALEWSGSADRDDAAIRKRHLPVLQRTRHRIEAMLLEVPDLVVSLMPSYAPGHE
jgi:IclR family transcriptional regulator, pca regulon regulatory protein